MENRKEIFLKNSTRNIKVVITDNRRQFNLQKCSEQIATLIEKENRRTKDSYGFNKYTKWI